MKLIFNQYWRHILISILGLLLVWILSYSIEVSEFQKRVYTFYKFSSLESHYLYLFHHIICFGPVFIFSMTLPWFKTKFEFISRWWKSILIGSILFCIWDLIFTKLQVWSFNEKYVLGINLGGFPLEEMMWFPLIAYCSLMIHHLLEKKSVFLEYSKWFTFSLLLVQFTFILLFHNRIYTSFSSWVVAAYMLIMYLINKQELLFRYSRSFLIILIPMILADGLLTGMFNEEPVVIYNPLEFSGIRIFSIPIEDFAFGYAFIGIIITIENYLNRRISAL